MRHSLPLATQFYVTAAQPCPYLDGRLERKLFTGLQIDHADTLNNSLSKQGFRRSQNVLYRPACTECNACLSARIRVADFQPSKSHKRILRKNSDLERNASSPWATEHQFELFKKYLNTRHATGGMADMDMFEFSAMIEETPIRSSVVEYTQNVPETGRPELKAVCLTDILDDGLSLVYSFYDPELYKSSLGLFMILDHISIAQEAGLPYVYLGYWVQGSPKMDYKCKFSALEIYYQNNWTRLDNPAEFVRENAPLGCDPISEQVAAINLPDTIQNFEN